MKCRWAHRITRTDQESRRHKQLRRWRCPGARTTPTGRASRQPTRFHALRRPSVRIFRASQARRPPTQCLPHHRRSVPIIRAARANQRHTRLFRPGRPSARIIHCPFSARGHPAEQITIGRVGCVKRAGSYSRCVSRALLSVPIIGRFRHINAGWPLIQLIHMLAAVRRVAG